MHRLLLTALCFLLSTSAFAAVQEPIRLDTGLLTGIAGSSSDVRVFRGIPFAAPPTGTLRWRAPQLPAHWEGVLKADEFGAVCMQPAFRGAPPPHMSEDCLYLNVWTAANLLATGGR